MNLDKFRKLEKNETQNIYGGFWQIFALILPFLIQSISTAAATFKMIESDNGSVKTKGYESHWSNNRDSSSATKNEPTSQISKIVYAY